MIFAVIAGTVPVEKDPVRLYKVRLGSFGFRAESRLVTFEQGGRVRCPRPLHRDRLGRSRLRSSLDGSPELGVWAVGSSPREWEGRDDIHDGAFHSAVDVR